MDEVATADIALEAEGNTKSEMFENAALATTEAMVELEKVKPTEVREVVLENEDEEQLLFEFLSEIVFYKDAEDLMFSKFEVKIDGDKLKAKMYGEEFNQEMGFKIDVKAITMHMLKVEKKNNKYKCTVVLDI